jgi:hypothetical protein
MPKVKISEYSATANSNTDVASINIDEGCAPSGINNAIRAVMGHLKDFQQGTNGDPFNGPVNGTLGATTAATANVTTLTTSSTITHNGGTANGVAYLNGSKVLTTGSALVFDGTNLGVGVTPSAWGSGYRAVMVNPSSAGPLALASAGDEGIMSVNAYNNAGWKYVSTGIASTYYMQTGGTHRWFNAASGTAGNAITFTQAMTLDASGRLGVGTTSPSAKLTVVGGNSSTIIADNDGSQYTQLLLQRNSTANTGGDLLIDGTNATMSLRMLAVGALRFCTSTSVGDGTERARIDSSGNLLVGTTSLPSPASQPTKGLAVSNAGNNGSWTGTFQGTGASTNRGVVVFYPNSSPNNVDNQAFYFIDSTTTRFEARSNGGIANYSANNVNLSDRREKTNFAPAKSYLDVICAIPVQTFNYIDQNMEDDGGLTLGVVAQDVQAVAPELVMESNWAGKDEEPKMRLSIYQTDLQYALMKCIQEMKTIIDEQAQRISVLEAK